jgi:glyoxylate reductase
MSKKKVFVARIIPAAGLNILLEAAEVTVWPGELPPTRTELIERVKGVDGIVSLLTDKIDGEVMDAAGPQLKIISNVAVGYDNVDVAAAKQRGILVTNTPGVLTETSADMAFALLLAAARRLPEGERYARAGNWKTFGFTLLLGRDVHGATLGIAGMGRIGAAVARRAKGFGMKILYTARKPHPDVEAELGAQHVSKETLLRESDFISLHTPLNAETRGYIGAAELTQMKPTAILINTARGPVVDTHALYEAMKAKRIFAAALDVTDPEPLPADHPLYTLDNVLIIPHLASASVATRNKMAEIAATNMAAGLRGERPENVVG